jgi:hypothetical protein
MQIMQMTKLWRARLNQHQTYKSLMPIKKGSVNVNTTFFYVVQILYSTSTLTGTVK